MKILWSCVALLIIIYETNNQMVRQQTFSNTGNVLTYSSYFNVYQSQTVSVTFSTRCPNLQIAFVNSGGNIFYTFSTSPYNNGLSYTFNFGIGGGMNQGISLVDWNNNRSCTWSYSFKLSFNCSIVTSYCYDCSSYTTCTSCSGGYFLYLNRCYVNIPNCLTRSGLSCAQCSSGYILVNGACRLCSTFMPNCQTCSSISICSTCQTGYALTAGNVGCNQCSSFITDCVTCQSSTSCTTCPLGYTVANPTTCQLCTATLTNCTYCSSPTHCTNCVPGYAVAPDGSCQTCTSFITDCILCSSSSYCTKCPSGYSLSPTACTVCSFTMIGCKQCSGTDCISCESDYWLFNGTCQACNSTINDCQSCSNGTYCTGCDLGFGLNTSSVVGERGCYPCSSSISHCLACSTLSSCNSCISGYVIYGGGCYACSNLMAACSTCTNYITCTACVSNSYALNTNNLCYSCSSYMDKCLTCSDRSTCLTCASGTVLKYARCKQCFLVLPYCQICSSETTCTSCQLTYKLDTVSGTCKPCQFFIANCSVCSSTTVCTQCLPGTILTSGQCKTCGEVFPNCIACVSNVSCALCDQGSVVYNNYCEPCKTFINHCSNCYETFHCQQCFQPYIPNSDKLCKCKTPLYNVSDFCVPDINCVSAYKKNGQIYCSFCNIKKLFYLDVNNNCVCKTGFLQINEQCVQYCGDGMIVNQQCDDNNTIDGDGCSSSCNIQPGFVCQQLASGVSKCRFVKNIQLKYEYTFKRLHENRGIITISLSSSDQNIKKFYSTSLFKFSISHNRSDSLNITDFYKNQQGQIILDIDYNQTIQGTNIELRFKFDNEYVISQDNFLKFPLKGSNYPLVISRMTDQFKFNSQILKYLALVGYVVALLMLFSDKFIAVEGIITLQLTFFSLLLIYENYDWPQAMIVLISLRYSTGFNQLIFQPNIFDNINNPDYTKFEFIGISNYFLPNNLINSVILYVALIAFFILFYLKTKPQNAILEIKNKRQKKRLTRKLHKLRIVFKRIYNITFNFSYTMIFQVIMSIYVEFSFSKNVSPLIKGLDKSFAVLTLTIIAFTILQNYKHLFLSSTDTFVQNFQVGSRQLKYKRVYFIYIVFNAVCLFFLNGKRIFIFAMSFYVLIVAVFYLLFLAIYRPYRYSFFIHGFTVIFNQVMHIVALFIINVLNFQIKMPEEVFLVFTYLIIVFSLAVLVFMIIRVFYEEKYGYEKTKKQIHFQVQGNQKQQHQLLLNKAAQMQEKNKQNNKNSQNSYLYQNQKLEVQQIQFLNELKSKKFLSEWQKDQAYFRVYDRKPIEWVQLNEPQEKYKILLQKEKQRFQRDVEKQQMIKIKNQKLLNNKYIDQMQNIKQILRNQRKTKQHKKKQQKQSKKSKKNTDKSQKKKDQN